MKNLQRGFVIPLLIVIVLLIIGVYIYNYTNKKVEAPVVIETVSPTLFISISSGAMLPGSVINFSINNGPSMNPNGPLQELKVGDTFSVLPGIVSGYRAERTGTCNLGTPGAQVGQKYTCNIAYVSSTQKQPTISILSPKSGDIFRVGQVTEIQWGTYQFKNGDNSIFDITEISSNRQSLIASVTPSQVGCSGHQAAACGYAWTPTSASLQDKISVSERGADRVGYSGAFSVVSPALIKPSITSISPSEGGANTQVTINGNNLSGAINVVFSVNGQSVGSTGSSTISSNGQNYLTFNVSGIHITPGIYQVSVLTAAGYSNLVSLIIK